MKCMLALCLTLVLGLGTVPEVGANEEGPVMSGFPLQLFQEVAKEHPEANVLVSPFSVKTALTMTYNGAAGDTRKEMGKALGFSALGSVEEAAAREQLVLNSLRQPGMNTQLEIANALFGEKSINFKPEFISVNKQYFGAQVNSIDFKSPDAVTTINKWVSEHTHEKIPTIIEQVGEDAILYLINAIYFKGAWQHKFDKALTKPGDFYLIDGSTKKVAMMHLSRDDFRYYETGDFKIVSLPYTDGRLSMYVILPGKETSLAAFEASLMPQMWSDLVNRLHKSEGRLTLPRFKLEDKMTLKEVLCRMGLALAFDPAKADFSEMSEMKQRIYISQVFHKTFMEVNEEGTEAAAATGVEMSVTMAMANPPPPFEMVVDRPFLIALRDNKTDSLLFMGHVVEPPAP